MWNVISLWFLQCRLLCKIRLWTIVKSKEPVNKNCRCWSGWKSHTHKSPESIQGTWMSWFVKVYHNNLFLQSMHLWSHAYWMQSSHFAGLRICWGWKNCQYLISAFSPFSACSVCLYAGRILYAAICASLWLVFWWFILYIVPACARTQITKQPDSSDVSNNWVRAIRVWDRSRWNLHTGILPSASWGLEPFPLASSKKTYILKGIHIQVVAGWWYRTWKLFKELMETRARRILSLWSDRHWETNY